METNKLNPYKIKWAIISKDGEFVSWNPAFKKATLKEGQTVHYITDAQFGHISIEYGGIRAKHTTPLKELHLIDTKHSVSYSIPITTKQLEEYEKGGEITYKPVGYKANQKFYFSIIK